MKIYEIFKSIQGEGQQQGEVTIFVRTTGCNFRCNWCDTKYAFKGGEERSVKEVIDKIQSLDCKNVCVTGGEPLLQPDIGELIDGLVDAKYNVFIETNGSQDIRKFNNKAHYVLDFKLPSSGMYDKFFYPNLNADSIYEIKFVIADNKDYEIAKNFTKKYKGKAKMLFSPCWGRISKSRLAELIIKDNLPVRYSLQIHKVIWSPLKRGV